MEKMRVQINGEGRVFEIPPLEALQAVAKIADDFANEADTLSAQLAASQERERVAVEALADIERKYNALARHHNLRCTCLEIY